MAASEQGSGGGSVWEKVLLLIGIGQEKETDPLLWALQLSSCLKSAEVSLPSIEVAEILVDCICGDGNVPIMWKFLEKAMVFDIVPPLLVLALLSTRVIANRDNRPSAYRLYMELLKRHAFALKSQIHGLNYGKVMKSIDGALHLTRIFGLDTSEPGVLVVEYIFSIIWQLLDASLEDEELMELLPVKESRWTTKSEDKEMICYDDKKIFRERLKSLNTTMAVEMIGQFLDDKVTSKLLYLARRNLPKQWAEFVGALELLGNSMALRSSRVMTAESLLQLVSDDRVVLSRTPKTRSPHKFHAIMAFGSVPSSAGLYHKDNISGFWLPLDLVLEDAMDGYQVSPTSSVEMIKGLIKDLQAINGVTWHDTFLNLWMSALRLVQREREPIEGPVPRLDARLCMLLCITTLVAADLIEEEENGSCGELNSSPNNQWKDQRVSGKLRKDLISSLQVLGDYQGLLIPPQSVVSAANRAAAKAMMSVSGSSLDSGYLECVNMKDLPFNCSGNLRHLIVEACIARNLLDTTAYYWPGYVNGQINQALHTIPSQVPSWSSFTKGTPLMPPIIKVLVSTPASSLADLEKVYEIAVTGTDSEKVSAATILCGASLIRGWNVQEHTARFITRLLAPPIPENYSGSESHLIEYAPVLNVLIVGIGSVDCVQIFSLLGLVPELAGSLMPICEIFGSCVPNMLWNLPTGEEISAHAVFSNAFTLLLKLWRFNHPPLEYSVGDVPPVGSHLTPEYLLLLRNSNLLTSRAKTIHGDSGAMNLAASTSSSTQPVFLDSFPKLRAWYRQHLACIASTLTGLVHGTPVHQIVDMLLNMMFRKINRGQPVVSVTSGSSSSSGTTTEDTSLRPKLPAWDILEAVPFVVDASLTACANGRLSPRELATGLKDLADFLPASLATIISYFSAEVTRGLWKPVFMNGTDWPSPAANLANVEEKITKILAATGVDVPTIAKGESSPATLPLPLAAFVSLTITYKIDKASERFLNLAGPALEVLAAGCPWPCMPIVASLWTLKAKRWSDFLIFSASRTVFLHNNRTIVQLIKSCFSATLGLNGSPITSNGGVGALLGHGYVSHFGGGISPVAPGILYLRVYRSLKEIMFITEEILSLLMQSVKEITTNGLGRESLEQIKKSKLRGQCRQVSLSQAMTKVKLAASLAASLVWLSGSLGLVQLLFKETLPSWFISVHRSEADSGGMVAMLGGYTLAYFTMLCGSFAWGIDSSSSASKRRPNIIGKHVSFLASALDGKISLGCDPATWHAYVTGFVSLMVSSTPAWVREVDPSLLKRLSSGLRQWNEEELALSLLSFGGFGTMGAAAELIIHTDW